VSAARPELVNLSVLAHLGAEMGHVAAATTQLEQAGGEGMTDRAGSGPPKADVPGGLPRRPAPTTV
jgi:hypothetical protein